MSSPDVFQLTILLLPTVVVCLVLVLRVAAEKPLTPEVLEALTGRGAARPSATAAGACADRGGSGAGADRGLPRRGPGFRRGRGRASDPRVAH